MSSGKIYQRRGYFIDGRKITFTLNISVFTRIKYGVDEFDGSGLMYIMHYTETKYDAKIGRYVF